MMLLQKQIFLGKERIYVRILPPALYVGVRDRIGKFVFSLRANCSRSTIRRHDRVSHELASASRRNSDRRRTIKPASYRSSR
jgi:hypothetical protein